MLFNDDLFTLKKYRAKDLEKAFVFKEIYSRRSASQKFLREKHKIRPTSVSLIFKELIEDGLIEEGKRINTRRPGRPEVFYRVNRNRLVCIGMYIESREIRGALVNIDNTVLAEEGIHISKLADNRGFSREFTSIINRLSNERPAGAEMLGIGISLPGNALDWKKLWISSLRFPHIRNFGFGRLEKSLGLSIESNKELKSILLSQIIQNPSYADGSTILFHWGYGIGFAHAHDGMILNSKFGKYGELGHTKVNLQTKKKCVCGCVGCLEAEAAVWALLPKLKRSYPELTADERSFAELLSNDEVLRHPAVKNAIGYIKVALINLYRQFYPERILVIGPFIENERVFTILKRQLEEVFPDSFPNRVVFKVVRDAHRGCIVSNTYPFFRERLRDMLQVRF